MLNVEVISKETIKPSSPTPQNLRYMHLSFFDQLEHPPVHSSVLFYYSHPRTTKTPSHLKKSLSEVLTSFYPLAGRIKKQGDDGCNDYTHVECDDQGVEFYEARVDSSLDKFLQHPSIEESNRLLPYEVPADTPLAVQFNAFTCGGAAIGVLLSHVLADAWSLFMFVNSWAATARGDAKKVVSPIFGFASLFPPKHVPKQVQQVTTAGEKGVIKRFVFEAPMIAKLREKVSVHAVFFPTRAEALHGLLWRCSIRAGEKEGHERKPVAMLVVDIRGRMEPPLLESSFGNLFVRVLVKGDRLIDDCGSDRVGHLERRFRESLGKIKGNGIREALESDGGTDISEIMWSTDADEWDKRGFDLSKFSGLGRFPVYESDFGWGKPDWVSFGNFQARNAVILMPTRDGEGIEAWVNLLEGEMAKFEQDPEILAYVRPVVIISKY